ncbi:PAS domain-containing protein [Marinomonas algarum]|uniref:histidine kinase n=1 Tax=Marinomonas algarum TaxID=2883105 RepID=A0A9X1IPL0_9GAMM|nr:PAS domain-containing protein [Marinomonas algarum]MCB5162827.1 PAS domain-containing protein [Marinomonas algarum]
MLTSLWNKLLRQISKLLVVNQTPNVHAPYRQVLDQLSDAVVILDHSLCVMYANRRWQRLSSHSKNTSSDYFIHYLHPDDHQKWQRAVRLTHQHGEYIELLIRLLIPGMDIKWGEVRIQEIHSHNTSFITVTIRDVTQRIQEENISNAKHRNLTCLVERMPAILYRGRNNHSWSMEYISEGCEDLIGYQPNQLINQPQLSFGDLIHPEDAEIVWQNVQSSLREYRRFELHYRLKNRKGHYLNVIEKGQGIYSTTGEILSIEGVIVQTL